MIEQIGTPFQIKLPHVAFHWHIGEFSSIKADDAGNLLSDPEWDKRRGEFLPSDSDRDFIESLMKETEDAAGRVRELDRTAQGRHRQ